ncbi:MAG: DinB superfamily metal-dependent hydrolase [Paenibacillus sp.]|jgi:uncharacterized damage-inducible protein DinB|nr:DinB superfamily metal-dependent hydrolase [Paenibacillus sp.]
MEAMLFAQMEFNRNRTIELVKDLSESFIDAVPQGFNNNIRWHLGHIVTVQERLTYRLLGESMDQPDEWISKFVNGTKPADWTEAPADMPTLLQLLEAQPARQRERLQGKMNTPLVVPFRDYATLQEAFLYSIVHEGLHAGYIMALKRAVAAGQ